MAERQILFDAVNVGCAEHLRVAQASPTFWVLALQQMPSASAAMHDFAAARDFETFADGFPGLNSFWPSHDNRINRD